MARSTRQCDARSPDGTQCQRAYRMCARRNHHRDRKGQTWSVGPGATKKWIYKLPAAEKSGIRVKSEHGSRRAPRATTATKTVPAAAGTSRPASRLAKTVEGTTIVAMAVADADPAQTAAWVRKLATDTRAMAMAKGLLAKARSTGDKFRAADLAKLIAMAEEMASELFEEDPERRRFFCHACGAPQILWNPSVPISSLRSGAACSQCGAPVTDLLASADKHQSGPKSDVWRVANLLKASAIPYTIQTSAVGFVERIMLDADQRHQIDFRFEHGRLVAIEHGGF